MLDKAKKPVRIKEAVHEQQDLLQRDTKGNPKTLDGVQANCTSATKRQSASVAASNLPRRGVGKHMIKKSNVLRCNLSPMQP